MSQKKLLYGASVQGIQGFIFQTNKLKDISGASELVEEICTITFAKAIYQPEETINATEKALKIRLQDDKRVLLNAAGKIEFLPENRLQCEAIVREFPKIVQEKAPGITVSQAVVEYDEVNENSFSNAVIELESRLRAQRNKPSRPTTLGLMGIHRSRNTGLPAVKICRGDFLDEATLAKRFKDKEATLKRETINLCAKALQPDILPENVAYQIEDITDKNSWIAVIHVDGNGLGQVVQRIGHKSEDFKVFSKELDEATILAARDAFKRISELYSWMDEVIPIRPVVLGGDDFTVICRADMALDYVKFFIEGFEKHTSEMNCFKKQEIFSTGSMKDRLTACAGIAYIKSSYPFYYAYNLAEALCSEAKKDAKSKKSVLEGKELPASCLMFHKLQDSFMDNYEELKKRELCPQENISFAHGPYYLHKDAADEHKKWTIQELQENANLFINDNAVRTHLRTWMSSLFENPDLSVQQTTRLKDRLDAQRNKGERWTCNINAWTTVPSESPVYDLLAIYTLKTQNTQRKEEEL